MSIKRTSPRSLLVASLLCGVFWPGILLAQTALDIGATLKTQNAVKLRALPPSQKFLFLVTEPGDEIAKMKEGEKIKIQEVKEIAVPFGKDIWVKGKTEKGETGWVYYGEKDKPVNFLDTTKAKE
ncbi:MAG: hypothetical protein NT159_03230 [Proteobacteria bacterium]|nr:hypothetical protein [Pseudomonadota bacterium]